MNKKFLTVICAATIALAGYVAINAAPVDVGVLQTGQGGTGTASQTYQVSRFSVAKVGAEANTPGSSITNVVQSTSGIVGKIVFVPGTVTDTLTVYNATAGSGTSVSTKVFECQANSPVNGNSPVTPLGVPAVYDLLPGWTCSSGIVTIITRPNTAAGAKAYISYDVPR
jgi:hypothetical protein